MLLLLSLLTAQPAQAQAQHQQYLYLGYCGGLLRFANNGHPEISDTLVGSGLVHGIELDWVATEEVGGGIGVPIFAFAMEFRGSKGFGGRLADGTALVADPLDPDGAIASYLDMLMDVDLSPWHVEVGPLALAPSLGLDLVLRDYNFDFGLPALDPGYYHENDGYFTQSYGDFLGLSAGVWVRFASLLGRVEGSWAPVGPMMATLDEPSTIWLVQSEVGSYERGQGGDPLTMRVELQWDHLVYLVPGLVYEGALWRVKTTGDTGEELRFTNRHRALYLTLSLGTAL